MTLKQIQEEIDKRFCSKCGAEMIATPDTWMNWVKRPENYPNFNRLTGEKIDYSGMKFRCPKDTFWNEHDNYFVSTHL